MDKAEISEVLRELNTATGFRISLHDAASEEICAYPTERRGFCAKIQESGEEKLLCESCDSSACKRALELGDYYLYKCRYGLCEIVSPIYNYGRLVGFLMMGQTAESKEDKLLADKALKRLGLKSCEREALISEIPTVSSEVSSSFAKILSICAKYLTLSGAVWGSTESLSEAAMRFMRENYARKIHIKDICTKLGCSKSTLLSAFKTEHGITVNSALCKIRLEAARRMLASQSGSINDVALASGFSDQSYFCKVFSAEYGESPSEYKKRTPSADD